MSTVEVKVATNNRASGPNPVAIYTVPAGKQAIVKSVNVRNIAAGGTSVPILQIKRSGVSTQISSVSLASTVSANMLAAPLTMASGDVLETIETSNATIDNLVLARFPDGSSDAAVVIVDGNVIICVKNGIFRSADAGLTFTKVSDFAPATNTGVKIGSSYFIYNTSSNAFRSTDGGITWTFIGVSNGPSASFGFRTISPQGNRIVFNGSVYATFVAASVIASTTDGITWTNFAANTPQAADCLVWSGTHWVCLQTTASANPFAFRSTDGTSWTGFQLASGITSQTINGLATDGNGVILTAQINTATYYRSDDHGANFTAIVGYFASQRFIFIGGVFLTSSGASAFSTTGNQNTFTYTTATLNAGSTFGVNATRVFSTSTGLRSAPLPISLATLGGIDVTASILEVTP
jgi:hypothetical protein